MAFMGDSRRGNCQFEVAAPQAKPRRWPSCCALVRHQGRAQNRFQFQTLIEYQAMDIENTSELRLLIECARGGSLTAASREMGITPPPPARCSKKVEARLGVRLAERSTRALRLTPAGERRASTPSARWSCWTRAWRRSPKGWSRTAPRAAGRPRCGAASG
ncbi:bacterial regulatory helix-turn-helix protein, lysR family domain-containing protein [Ditylenchus destructor]|nr:bacterial regulatory helix-turn-helix protein, lysR family domain-containing protein [Ditylenchus destructor]